MSINKENLLVVITGPTATGKTSLAANLAHRLNGEVISADSRQVYRGMDIGTGKDLEDYQADGKKTACHLIDIRDPGYEYNVYEFQQDFLHAFEDIVTRGKLPVLCGGTGLYIDAAVSGYRLISVPENKALREELRSKPMETLVDMLAKMKELHNTTDIKDKNRVMRAIEIAVYEKAHGEEYGKYPDIKPVIFALAFERSILRERITRRLNARLEKGMVKEVEDLLDGGLDPSQLRFYGLEYRYVTDFVTGRIDYDDMVSKLNTAIHQFARRQMTWFRRMERKGHTIHWIDGMLSEEAKCKAVISMVNQASMNTTG